MKKNLFTAVTALLVAVGLSACTVTVGGKSNAKSVRGEGPKVTRDYDFTGFDHIALVGVYDVRFIQTDGEFAVSVCTNENVFEYLNLKQDGNTLQFKTKDRVSVKAEVNVTVKAPSLRLVSVSGTADFKADSIRTDGDFSFSVAGAGDMEVGRLVCDNFNVQVSGSGDVEVDALSCKDALVNISGSGDVELENVEAKYMSVSISGAGKAKLTGQADRTSIRISGAGDVDLRHFTAGELSKNISGVGKIRQ